MATHDASSQSGPGKATGPLERAQEEAIEAGRQGIGAAQNRIRTVFEQQSHRAADQIGSVAQALHSAVQQLEAENNGAVARYTGLAAERVEQFADTLRNSTVDDLVAQVENYARRQPEIFLGAAFGIGFLFARFIKSSGDRIRMADLTRQQGLAGHQSGQMGGGTSGGGGGTYDYSTERQNIGGSYPAGARSVDGGGAGGGRDQARPSPPSTPGSTGQGGRTASSAGMRDAAQMMAVGSPEPIKSESATGEPNRAEPVSGTGKPQESKP